MERLFLELYLDEDVSVLIAELLQARGFHATTTLDAGQMGRNDEEQLAYATSRRKTLLTHNRVDFERLAIEYFESGRTHFGILVAVRRPVQEIARRLLIILDRVTADEMINQIRYF
ncbi:MAG TPA: DUF5615 family PIN-like protein [Pyrinomonadaceae bacterium]|nr:DUF5615 family PIN-like protein [Pyrinomonadaceae bacterium]